MKYSTALFLLLTTAAEAARPAEGNHKARVLVRRRDLGDNGVSKREQRKKNGRKKQGTDVVVEASGAEDATTTEGMTTRTVDIETHIETLIEEVEEMEHEIEDLVGDVEVLEAEVWLEGQTEVLLEGEAEVLLEGEADDLLEGEAEILLEEDEVDIGGSEQDVQIILVEDDEILETRTEQADGAMETRDRDGVLTRDTGNRWQVEDGGGDGGGRDNGDRGGGRAGGRAGGRDGGRDRGPGRGRGKMHDHDEEDGGRGKKDRKDKKKRDKRMSSKAKKDYDEPDHGTDGGPDHGHDDDNDEPNRRPGRQRVGKSNKVVHDPMSDYERMKDTAPHYNGRGRNNVGKGRKLR